MSTEEYDWIFDFALQFLESDAFDASVMDFVDEKCDVFEDEEENKLVYTDIHREFCEHVEALINSNLGELGITPEVFLEACTKAKGSRDINSTVFERLIAMDDFQTFKKIMATRNAELQLESIKQLQQLKKPMSTRRPTAADAKAGSDIDSLPGAMSRLMNPDELQVLKDEEEAFMNELDRMPEEEVQELLFQSLMEMEMLHRQEELEHAELERALQMSLMAEEERLRVLMASDPNRGFGCMSPASRDDAKGTNTKAVKTLGQLGLLDIDAPAEKPSSSSGAGSKANSSSASFSSQKESFKDTPPSATNLGKSLLAEPKAAPKLEPLALKPLPSQRNPLPSIGLSAGLDIIEKKKIAETVIRQNQDQLAAQRRKEEELRQQVNGIDPSEAERRAAHMREQRDRLVAMKRAEREKKVQAEAERKGQARGDGAAAQRLPAAVTNLLASSGSSSATRDAKSSGTSAEAIAEDRRSALRDALARRMKMDLLQKEEAKLTISQSEQYSALDKKLQEVEQTREDNRRREYIMSQQVERQKALIAKNIQMSAAALSQSDGFDA